MIEFILVVIGLIAGIMGSLLGLGGGIIIVPALLEMARFSPQLSTITPAVAVGTSLVLILLGSCSSTFAYIKQKRIDFKRGILFFLGCSPGALLGSYLTAYVQSADFYIGFGFMILIMSLMLELKKRMSIDVSKKTLLHPGLALFISFLVGIISGLFGLGGGILLLPFMLFSGFPIHIATSTSVFIIFLSSLAGTVTHFYLGNIYWHSVLFLGPGMIIGGIVGAWLSPKLRNQTLFLLLRVILVVVALEFIYKGIVYG
jgi:uncharacterized membrane protein YfcA